jgi:hypothetical protein
MGTPTESNQRQTTTQISIDGEDWFFKLLSFGNIGLDLVLNGLEFICRSLLELCKTFIKISLGLTIAYAVLIWRHYPATEPHTLIICWCAGLVAVNLGEKALDGQNAPSIHTPLAMLIIAYWFPVNSFSELIQAF